MIRLLGLGLQQCGSDALSTKHAHVCSASLENIPGLGFCLVKERMARPISVTWLRFWVKISVGFQNVILIVIVIVIVAVTVATVVTVATAALTVPVPSRAHYDITILLWVPTIVI